MRKLNELEVGTKKRLKCTGDWIRGTHDEK